jgi:hypothetical protein
MRNRRPVSDVPVVADGRTRIDHDALPGVVFIAVVGPAWTADHR